MQKFLTKSLAKKLSKFLGDCSELRELVEGFKDEQQEKYDNLSEKAQEGENGEARGELIELLENVIADMETLEGVIGCIELDD